MYCVTRRCIRPLQVHEPGHVPHHGHVLRDAAGGRGHAGARRGALRGRQRRQLPASHALHTQGGRQNCQERRGLYNFM